MKGAGQVLHFRLEVGYRKSSERELEHLIWNLWSVLLLAPCSSFVEE